MTFSGFFNYILTLFQLLEVVSWFTKDHCSPKGAGESLKVTCQEYSLILIIIDSDEIKHYIKYRSLNSGFSVQSQERL